MRLPIAALVLILATSAASAETVSGPVRVIDGDTLAFGAVKVRILDIDAPESRQPCIRPDGVEWRCGQQVHKSQMQNVPARPSKALASGA